MIFLGLVGLQACKTAEPPPPASIVPDAERPFLLSPLTALDETRQAALDPAAAEQIRQLFESFERGRPAAEVAAVAERLLVHDSELAPARLLLAQARYLANDFAATVAALREIGDGLQDYSAAQLLLARALERLGEIPEAYESFSALANRSALAAAKAGELAGSAQEILRLRIAEALAQARIEDALAILTRLESWAPGELKTLEARLSVVVAQSDVRAEIETLRQIVRQGATPEWRSRLGDLEVEQGDVRAGLEIFENLLKEFPDDASYAERAEKAKFRWRLDRLPARIQQIARKAELSRGDLAALIYWLLPPVRYSQVLDPPIAGDILDHPAQQEIVKVVNLGLMDIDETLHRFQPEANTNRRAGLGALLTLLQKVAKRSCVEGELPGRDNRAWVCRHAAACGFIANEAECLPSAPLSGSQAVDLIRLCLEALESS